MKNSLAIPRVPESDADYERAVEEVLTEICALNERMDSDRVDIERLKAETRQLKDETRLMLSSMGVSL